ncbi:GSCOCG00011284001-RA-CDS [Cotesia congregata]|nr:GSCOCG00011284001-RA-CDS [Cotesia congregata]
MDSTCPSRNPIHGDLSALSSRQDLGLLRPWRLWERSRSAGWFAESAVGSDSIGATAAMDWATWPARAGQGRTGAVAAGGVVRWITSRRPVLSLRAAISMKRWEAGEPLITWRVLDGARPIGRYSKRKMAKVLQINLHRCKLALDLLYARNRDNGMDIVLVSEQYHSVSGPNWYCDPTGTAAIWIPDQSRLSVPDSGARDGIVWVETPAVTVVSCYFTPSEPIADFRKKVDNLDRVVRHLEGEIVIGGDFNAKSIDWGMGYSDTRGDELLDMMAGFDFVIMNRGNTPTFRRAGARWSILDLTFATQRIAGVISDWAVLEEYTASDHQYISYTVNSVRGNPPTVPEREMKQTGWKVSLLDESAFQNAVSDRIDTLTDSFAESRENVESLVGRTMDVIVAGCDAAMPRRPASSRRKPVDWL